METQFLTVGDGTSARRIAVRRRAGAAPGIFWLGGFRSDMQGAKAQAIGSWCAGVGIACCRHDYSGHGESGGAFRDGTISRWIEESLAVFDAFTTGPQALVGSSMGGWIALRMAQNAASRGDSARLHAMLLIAPAPDFTEKLMWPRLTQAQQAAIIGKGFLEVPSHYSPEPDIYTRDLFEDGRKNLVLTGSVTTRCPVHIVQGRRDQDVPWMHAMELAAQPSGETVSMTLVPDGDHRLSRPQDLALITDILAGMVAPQ